MSTWPLILASTSAKSWTVASLSCTDWSARSKIESSSSSPSSSITSSVGSRWRTAMQWALVWLVAWSLTWPTRSRKVSCRGCQHSHSVYRSFSPTITLTARPNSSRSSPLVICLWPLERRTSWNIYLRCLHPLRQPPSSVWQWQLTHLRKLCWPTYDSLSLNPTFLSCMGSCPMMAHLSWQSSKMPSLSNLLCRCGNTWRQWSWTIN